MTDTKVAQSIYGAALLDSLSTPASYHLRLKVRPNLGEKLRDHLRFAEENMQTNIFPAFSLPQHSSILHPTPSDDLEWLAFSAKASLHGNITEYWNQLIVNISNVRGRTGTRIALTNRKNGNYVNSGYDNPQYFDDIAMIRAVGISLVNRYSEQDLQQSIEEDATITHALDGVWAAKAVGFLIWKLFNSVDRRSAILETVSELPNDSWINITSRRAIERCSSANSVFERVMVLEKEVIDQVPSHPNSAPETFSCLIAHALYSQSLNEFLFAAFAHPRLADSLPALHGALAGLLFDTDWVPSILASQIPPLTGCCLPNLAGLGLMDLIEQITLGR